MKKVDYKIQNFYILLAFLLITIAFLKVMKRATYCKHRQPVKTIQCEKKLFNSQ